MTGFTRRTLLAACAAAGAPLAMPAIGRAAAPVELSFYFPVAVGGPITRIIDGSARSRNFRVVRPPWADADAQS